jgi:hypothetical protein
LAGTTQGALASEAKTLANSVDKWGKALWQVALLSQRAKTAPTAAWAFAGNLSKIGTESRLPPSIVIVRTISGWRRRNTCSAVAP